MGIVVYDDANGTREQQYLVKVIFDITHLYDKATLLGLLVLGYSIYDNFSIQYYPSLKFEYVITLTTKKKETAKAVKDDIIQTLKKYEANKIR